MGQQKTQFLSNQNWLPRPGLYVIILQYEKSPWVCQAPGYIGARYSRPPDQLPHVFQCRSIQNLKELRNLQSYIRRVVENTIPSFILYSLALEGKEEFRNLHCACSTFQKKIITLSYTVSSKLQIHYFCFFSICRGGLPYRPPLQIHF